MNSIRTKNFVSLVLLSIRGLVWTSTELTFRLQRYFFFLVATAGSNYFDVAFKFLSVPPEFVFIPWRGLNPLGRFTLLITRDGSHLCIYGVFPSSNDIFLSESCPIVHHEMCWTSPDKKWSLLPIFFSFLPVPAVGAKVWMWMKCVLFYKGCPEAMVMFSSAHDFHPFFF